MSAGTIIIAHSVSSPPCLMFTPVPIVGMRLA